MVIDIDLSMYLSSVTIIITIIITSWFYFKQDKKLNSEYLLIIMASSFSGYTMYIGLLFFFKNIWNIY